MLVDCRNCSARVDADVLEGLDVIPNNDDVDPYRLSFLRCPSCNDGLLAIEEYLPAGGSVSELSEPVRLYPPLDRQLAPAIPRALRDIHKEARLCFRSGAYTACALLCRKCVEGVCNDKLPAGTNLAAALRKLNEAKEIDDRLYQWSDALRVSGNEAAHDVGTTVDKQHASDLLKFLEALLDYVYTFREEFDRFQKRRHKRPKAP